MRCRRAVVAIVGGAASGAVLKEDGKSLARDVDAERRSWRRAARRGGSRSCPMPTGKAKSLGCETGVSGVRPSAEEARDGPAYSGPRLLLLGKNRMVTETMFDADGWIARLGASLEALAPTATYSVSLEAGYVSHLSYDEFRAIQGEAGRDPAILDAVAPGYASLRSDAEEQRAMLHEHPVLKEVLKGSSGEEHMLLLRPGCSNGTNTKGLVSHLVAQSVKKSGADAAGVLHRFLAEGKDRRLDAREYVVIYGVEADESNPIGRRCVSRPPRRQFHFARGVLRRGRPAIENRRGSRQGFPRRVGW